jgi:hypothetical protein
MATCTGKIGAEAGNDDSTIEALVECFGRVGHGVSSELTRAGGSLDGLKREALLKVLGSKKIGSKHFTRRIAKGGLPMLISLEETRTRKAARRARGVNGIATEAVWAVPSTSLTGMTPRACGAEPVI